MNDLNKELKNQAIALGLCKPWQDSWKKDWPTEKMVERMYKGLDFCLKHHWPANDFILKHFDQEFRRNGNVYVNDKYSVWFYNPAEGEICTLDEMLHRGGKYYLTGRVWDYHF